jgi:hypothetical protein
MVTILKALGIDHAKSYDIGRPIGIVANNAKPIPQLF